MVIADNPRLALPSEPCETHDYYPILYCFDFLVRNSTSVKVCTRNESEHVAAAYLGSTIISFLESFGECPMIQSGLSHCRWRCSIV